MTDPLDLFAAAVQRFPDRLAVVAGDSQLTYAQLDARARRFATCVARHAAPRVLIFLPNGTDAFAAMLGVGQGGGVYAPVSINTPAHKLGRILDQLRPDVVITDAAHAGMLPATGATVTLYTVEDLPDAGPAGHAPRHESAYIVFTCDAKGRLRGVDIPRRGLSAYVDWVRTTFALSHTDRLAQFVDLSVDISVTDFYGAICTGATLFSLRQDADLRDPAEAIRRHGITVLSTFPSQIDLMSEAGKLSAEYLGTLRLVTLCRHTVPRRLLDRVFAALPRLTVHVVYGPPEATVAAAYQRLTAADYAQNSGLTLALGTPLPKMKVALSQQPGQRLGELVISGPQLARGYVTDADEDTRAFRRNEDGDRVFRTRDIFAVQSGELHFDHRATTDSALVD